MIVIAVDRNVCNYNNCDYSIKLGGIATFLRHVDFNEAHMNFCDLHFYNGSFY